jgi:membrane protein
MVKLRAILGLVKDTARQWYAHDTFQMGAALAYYTAFSLAPVVMIAIGIAGVVFGRQKAQRQMLNEINQTVGPAIGKAFQDTLQYSQTTGAGTLATLVGIGLVLFGATSVFAQLQTSLNTIWGVQVRADSGMWQWVKSRLLSFAMVLAIGFLLLVSLVVSAALQALNFVLTPDSHPGGVYLWQVVNGIISFSLITLLFALIYKILPDAGIAWRNVWIGAAVTALLFTAGKYLIGLYLGRSSIASSYGAAASLVVVLLWVYYSSQIFLFGAEFTRVYTERSRSPIVPADNAVLVSQGLASQPSLNSSLAVPVVESRSTMNTQNVSETVLEEQTLLGKKLEELAQASPSGKEIADEVAGSSEETAELFSSRYRPAFRTGEEEGGEAPDGVNIRFAPR